MGFVRHEHTMPKKAQFKALVQYARYSGRVAAKELKILESIARKWLHQLTDRRTRSLSSKPGRPRVITDEHINQMILWITGHYDRRILPLKTIAKEACGITTVSHRTLVRAWAKWGYHLHTPDTEPFLSQPHKLSRFTFAVKNYDKLVEYWRKGIYTDETVTRTNLRRRAKVLRKRGERRRLDCIQFTFNSGRDFVMCWAAIGYNFKSQLYFVSTDGQGHGFTQKKYEEQILQGPSKGIFEERHSHGFFCVEDGSRGHGLKDTRKNKSLCNATRVECHINTLLDWLPCSSDLNPIENLWEDIETG